MFVDLAAESVTVRVKERCLEVARDAGGAVFGAYGLGSA
jgi:hypothetical protein